MRVMRASCGGKTLASRVRRADGFASRLRGLMFRAPLAPDAGLWLSPCNSVHTAFCAGALDIVFLDRDARVLRVVPALRPWRAAACRGAHAVLELAPGAAAALRQGDLVELDEQVPIR